MNFFIFSLLIFTLVSCADADSPVKKKLLLESQANYSGSCPCPFSLDKEGKRCDEESQHSKSNGTSPVCYESDVTQEMVLNYKKRSSAQ